MIVDGAHSFAHFAFKLSELECDYFGTSLHKWLFAPFDVAALLYRDPVLARAAHTQHAGSSATTSGRL